MISAHMAIGCITYGNPILGWMNIHLPPILMFTRGFLGFDPQPHAQAQNEKAQLRVSPPTAHRPPPQTEKATSTFGVVGMRQCLAVKSLKMLVGLMCLVGGSVLSPRKTDFKVPRRTELP